MYTVMAHTFMIHLYECTVQLSSKMYVDIISSIHHVVIIKLSFFLWQSSRYSSSQFGPTNINAMVDIGEVQENTMGDMEHFSKTTTVQMRKQLIG